MYSSLMFIFKIIFAVIVIVASFSFIYFHLRYSMTMFVDAFRKDTPFRNTILAGILLYALWWAVMNIIDTM